MSEFLVKCIKPGACLHLKQGEVYAAYHANTYDGVTRSYVVFDNSGGRQRYMASRFEIVPEEKEQPKMGAIYMICVIINVGLKTNDYDVIPDDLVNETFIEHTLDAAKNRLSSLNAGIEEGGQSCDQVACIFELHSYYENRPFFVEVKR